MKGSIAIRTTGLTRKYNEKTAVDHLGLTIHEGELFALLGVNGAGKTTTIRMLTCLTVPTEGTAEIFGHDVSRDLAPLTHKNIRKKGIPLRRMFFICIVLFYQYARVF